MNEIRLHGRGGQGVAISAEMLVAAFVKEGKSATGFPMFGVDRRGTPVSAFVRSSDKPIREKTKVYSPNCLLILDPLQIGWPIVYSGLRSESILVVNSPQPPKENPHKNLSLTGFVDATKIALEEIGIPASNTCMIGAFAAVTQWVKLDSILSALEMYFKERMLEKNLRSAERGFHEVEVVEWSR